MQFDTYHGEFLAGLFFLIAGFRLLRLAVRTGESPEWQLGAHFALAGLSYLVYVLPRMVEIATLDSASYFASRAFYSIAMIPFVQFTRDVFRQESTWAKWLVRSVMLSLACGILGGVVNGEWEGVFSVWFWCYFMGYSTAIVWMTIEAILAYSAARRRLSFGLCEVGTANRYFLWASFGVFQTLACAAVIAWEFEAAFTNSVSSVLESLLGATEILSVGMVWLAFFAPSFYRKWIDRVPTSAEGA